jgi:FixJ family two-component response regulator
MMKRKLTRDDIQKIREEIIRGKSKYQVARELNLHPTTVYEHTQDLPSKVKREPYISGKPLELLKELLEKGVLCKSRLGNIVW